MATDDEKKPTKKKGRQPSDFDSEQDFLTHIRKQVSLDEAADKDNRDAAIEDSKFFIGDQWPSGVKERRDSAKKPTMTENYLPAFVGQIVGNRRLNETVIKVVPDNGGTKAIAGVREGLIRNIQKVSKAEIAYNKAAENQAICGIGNFQVVLEYASNDVFEQDIKIRAIPNAFAVVWDRMSVDPTGADAGHVTVSDKMPTDAFKREYPDASSGEVLSDTYCEGWRDNDTVRVASFWRMRKRKRELALFLDGSVQDITGKDDSDLIDPETNKALIVQRADGSYVMREAEVLYAECYVVSATDILDGPYELPITRVPVFRVPGWEVNVGEVRHRWGIVRFLKDSQRGHNYWRSVVNEKLMQTPKAKWIATADAVQGREKAFRNAALSDDPLLVYNGEAGQKPELMPPAQLEQALVVEANTSLQAMRDISNIHEASLGEQSNEVSGKAIIARQRVGELGSVLYLDNQNLAIEASGGVINELIPYVYDTPRMIKVLGPDDKAAMQIINNPNNPQSIDITSGKYAITLTTGPSFVTKRAEAAESMLNLINAMPQAMAVAADKIVEAQDWPGAEEIATRLRKTLPPGMIPQDDMTPDEEQAQQGAAQAQQIKMDHDAAMAKAELDKVNAEVNEINARASLARAQASRAVVEPRIKAAEAETKSRSTRLNDTLAAIETAHQGDDKDAAGKPAKKGK